MPIVSSKLIKFGHRRRNRLYVYEQHVDHVGVTHDHRYTCISGEDLDANLLKNVPKLNAKLTESEGHEVEDKISKGLDPNDIPTSHMTNKQKLKSVVIALMRAEAKNVFKAASIVDGVSDAVLRSIFSPARLVRIRTRVSYVLTNKSVIETDDLQREENI